MATAKRAKNDPLWYKDAVIYELHVRAFCDSDGDGIGDFQGLIQKLDYLQDLGVTALWLLPFYPSPLKDDGYDIADYTNIHPSYGALNDFKDFLREAHQRNLKVITELVLNHTSDQHPWFQRSRRAKSGSRWRDFYVWSQTPEKYTDARIIFRDFEASNWSWDRMAKSYYWHRFYSHQPDLNYENPAVRKAILDVVDFWMELGVDGMRLDAVPYLYEKEGANCENLPESHAFLKKLRAHVDRRFKGRMLLAEANQWPEDAVAYFGNADECHMAFHFPLMPRLFMASRLEERHPIIDILSQTPAIPESCQWAIFLRNHDELTLEMVTDEERDYMYRVYANDPQMRINLGIRRRLAPLLGNNRRKIELMNGLLLAMSGTPVIYYGDEIGMGDNIYLGDRNGVRTPMQWSADRNAGFSRCNPQRLFLPIIIDPEYHYEAFNVEAQQDNPSSMLWWTKRLISLRKRYKAFSRGTVEVLYPDNRKVLALLRRYQDETLLVLANLSRFTQCAELDLSAFKGMIPVELFGSSAFPTIGELPYFFTLGPHTFYWFALQPHKPTERRAIQRDEPWVHVEVKEKWQEIFEDPMKETLQARLPHYLARRRWFGSKARTIQSVVLKETIEILPQAVLAMLQVSYTEGEMEHYQLPLAFVQGSRAEEIVRTSPEVVLVELRGASKPGWIIDALQDPTICRHLIQSIAQKKRWRGKTGEINALLSGPLNVKKRQAISTLNPVLMSGEQSNTSILYGDQLILKVYRRVDEGVNPDLEIGQFLTHRTSFRNVPAVVGSIEYKRNLSSRITLGLLQKFVPNEGDAWCFTLEALAEFYERALAHQRELPQVPVPSDGLMVLAQTAASPIAERMISTYLSFARLLGQRTAELHIALASDTTDGQFAPEPFSALYQRSLYQSIRSRAAHALATLRQRLDQLPDALRAQAQQVLTLESTIAKRLRTLLDHKITAMRIRCHGDYHLGQVLYTGSDFYIIDFEGEPARSLSERRIKRATFRDVAGMLRSFHYAAFGALWNDVPRSASAGIVRYEDQAALKPWAEFWYAWVTSSFLRAYLQTASAAVFLPKTNEELSILLDACLLEKAVYELGYELNNRPDWVHIPIRGLLALMQSPV